jgi:hypothetical protein
MFIQKLRVNLVDLATAIAKVVDLMNAAVGQHHMQVAYWAYRWLTRWRCRMMKNSTSVLPDCFMISVHFHCRNAWTCWNLRTPKPGEHAIAGSLILEPFKPFAAIAELVKFHHLPWKNGSGAFQDGVRVPAGSHILHLADRVAVQISLREPVLAQVRDICASISGRSGEVFVPEQVDALLP